MQLILIKQTGFHDSSRRSARKRAKRHREGCCQLVWSTGVCDDSDECVCVCVEFYRLCAVWCVCVTLRTVITLLCGSVTMTMTIVCAG